MRLAKPLTVFMALAALPALASGPRTVTLDEAVSTALEKNNMLGAARAQVQKAEGVKKEAFSYRFPRLDLGLSFSRTDNPVYVFMGKLTQQRFAMEDFAIGSLNDPSPLTNYQGRLSFMMPLYAGGRINSYNRAADLGLEASRDRLREAEGAVRKGAMEAFYGSLLAERAVGVFEQAVETAKAHEKMVSLMHREGMVLDSDLLRIRVYLSDLEQELASRKADLEVARSFLAYVMGTGEQVVPAGDLETYSPVERSLEELLAAGEKARGELMAMEKTVGQASEGVRIKRSEYLPQVGVGATLERDYSTGSEYGKNWTVGVEVRIPIFDGGGKGGALMQARSDELAAMSALADLRLKVDIEIKEAYLKLKAAEQRLAVTASQLEQAKENQRIVSKRYEEGMALVTELLDADVLMTSTALSRAKSFYDAIIQKASLAKAAGGLETFETGR